MFQCMGYVYFPEDSNHWNLTVYGDTIREGYFVNNDLFHNCTRISAEFFFVFLNITYSKHIRAKYYTTILNRSLHCTSHDKMLTLAKSATNGTPSTTIRQRFLMYTKL